MRVLIFFAIASLMCSCATVSKNECLATDWHQEGYKAGFWDLNVSEKVAYYNQNCGKEHGIHLDPVKFDSGYKKGREYLCTKEGGYEFGRDGGVYNNQCEKEKEDNFFVGYQRGQAIYTSGRIRSLESKVDQLEDELAAKNSRIHSLESEIDRLKSQPGKN